MRITIRNSQKKIPIDPKRIKKTILKVLSKENKRTAGEITVYFADDQKIKELNFRFLGKDTPTDVLAFDMSKAKGLSPLLADIAISTDTAVRNSRVFKTTRLYELYLYLVHGLLHILGYDHRGRRQKQLMRQKEREYVHT
ncbi:MAG: rRNA maturation RNase YbeY [Candidatus Omnitrophota bacterium]